MVASAVEGIDLFNVAGRSISGWVPSFKMGATSSRGADAGRGTTNEDCKGVRN